MANNEPQIQPSAAALVTNERIARLEEKDLQKETTITGLSDDIRSLKRLQDGHRIECKEDFAARAELTDLFEQLATLKRMMLPTSPGRALPRSIDLLTEQESDRHEAYTKYPGDLITMMPVRLITMTPARATNLRDGPCTQSPSKFGFSSALDLLAATSPTPAIHTQRMVGTDPIRFETPPITSDLEDSDDPLSIERTRLMPLPQSKQSQSPTVHILPPHQTESSVTEKQATLVAKKVKFDVPDSPSPESGMQSKTKSKKPSSNQERNQSTASRKSATPKTKQPSKKGASQDTTGLSRRPKCANSKAKPNSADDEQATTARSSKISSTASDDDDSNIVVGTREVDTGREVSAADYSHAVVNEARVGGTKRSQRVRNLQETQETTKR